MEKIVILGAGESGVGAAILAKDKGFDVFVSDYGKISPKYKQMLDNENIAWEEDGHSLEKILDASIVVKSPGIAMETPVMQAVAKKGISVASEIEFAGLFMDAKTICITGSNGKTTTTLLTYHILKKAGMDVGLAGNVGKSLALQVARDPHKVYVIELSSFQLDNMYRFHANIAILLNITPDHLDRYEYKMENYVDAKFRILQNQTTNDAFIYWTGDHTITNKLESIKAHATTYPFAEHPAPGLAAYVDADNCMEVHTDAESFAVPRKDISLSGLHNLYNAMAASTAAALAGVNANVIAEALADFPGVEHRLEYVRTLDGVKYINDSKATNVNSTFYALQAMTTPVVLILGGKDKGNDYTEILPFVKEKVRKIVAMGLHNEKIMDFFGNTVPVVSTDNLTDAIAECRQAAMPGDTVLLSPCCASFDLFKSYEDRGEKFKNAVNELS